MAEKETASVDYKTAHLLPRLSESPDDAAGYIAASLRDNIDSPESIALALQDVIEAYNLPIDVSLKRSPWLPIESVPKDGTEVLLVWQWDSGIHKGASVVMAAWRCRAHSFLSAHHDCPNEAGCDMNWDSYGGRMTHWMPLPALPDPPEVKD